MVADAGQAPSSATGMGLLLADLQDENMPPVFAGLIAIGLFLFLAGDQSPRSLPLYVSFLVLCFLVAAAWALRLASHRASAWMLVIGCVGVDLLVVAWAGYDAALYLLALPTGLAVSLIGVSAGALMAAVGTGLVLLAPPTIVPDDPALQAAALIGVWSTLGLMCLTLRPLVTILQWSWSSCAQSRRLLDQARDQRLQLKQTLADLADANLQLTRLNRLAQSLRQAAEDARRTKERFVANVSHELRTPLNMVIGFSETILQAPESYGGRIPPTLLADLTVILRNSQHLSALIDDVLDLSQIEAGQMALTKERTALGEIIEAACVAVCPLYSSKGIDLETEVPEDLPPVLCDQTRIREVVLNLLSNAGRFTERGGVCVRVWEEAGDVVVSVADTGPGIADDDKERLFRPFEQLDTSLHRRYGGTGLGLSISKSFVELHGGRMWLESKVGRGTTFYFNLPLAPAAPLDAGVSRWFSPHWHYEERQRPSLAPVPRMRPRLVVLERGNSLRRLVSRYLHEVEIVSVGSFEEARRELERVPTQALLANGAPAAEALQRLDAPLGLPDSVPAIICEMPGANEAAETLGVAGYLVKPVSRNTLLGTLDGLPIGGKTVLVVDNEPEATRLFRRMLNSFDRGYRVLTANEGQQALQILRGEHPDLLLLDLVMPGMDGFQLLAAKSKDATIRDIPVVVISARDPMGSPIVTKSLAITQRGGLTVPQLLACVEAVSGPFSRAAQATGRASTTEPRG